MSTTRKASRRWSRGDRTKKYHCTKDKHVKGCRASRPLCKHRRAVCRCSAAHWPHRPGSLRGCREGGIPEAILKSRSYRQASRRVDRGSWRTRIVESLRKVRGSRGR